MRIKAIAFDMDGTLYSSEPLIEDVYRVSVEAFNRRTGKNYPAPPYARIEPLIGQPVKDIYRDLFPGITEEEIGELGREIMEEFCYQIGEYGGRLFEGVKTTLEDLCSRGIRVLIASNGRREYLQSILDKFALQAEPFVCVEEKGIRRKGQILKYYLEYYGLNSDEILMVGDRSSDLEAARETGCLFAGLDFGHGRKEEIREADFFLSHISQVLDVLERIEEEGIA